MVRPRKCRISSAQSKFESDLLRKSICLMLRNVCPRWIASRFECAVPFLCALYSDFRREFVCVGGGVSMRLSLFVRLTSFCELCQFRILANWFLFSIHSAHILCVWLTVRVSMCAFASFTSRNFCIRDERYDRQTKGKQIARETAPVVIDHEQRNELISYKQVDKSMHNCFVWFDCV